MLIGWVSRLRVIDWLFAPLLLLLGAWTGASTAQAAIADAVAAWGDNEFGQTTVPLAAQNGVTAIAAGEAHTVALKNDGTVVAWGGNEFGQVTGTPSFDDHSSTIANPLTLGGGILSGVTAIAAGGNVTVALKTDGSVVAWGDNGYGQTNVPVGLSGVTAIATGGSHILALKTDGSVVAWGWNFGGQMTVPTTAQSGVTAIAAGDIFSVALKTDGSVITWGNTSFGQTTGLPALIGVRAIAAGADHTVALKSDGSVGAWGANEFGQVTGIPSPDEPSTAIANPVVLGGQVLSEVTAIAAGASSTWAVKSDNTVVAWGVTGIARPNEPSTAIANPVTLGGQVLTGVTAIAAGFALKSDGSVVAWGLTPMDVPGGLSGITAVAEGWGGGDPGIHHVALKNDGTVVAWGNNPYGEVTGTNAGYTLDNAIANPVTLGGLVLSGVIAIAAGAHSTFALKNDGSVVEWGWTFMDVPAGLSGVTAIAAGAVHTVALKSDGTVVAWGNNVLGATDVPAGLSGVTAIAAGRLHTVALLGTAVTLQARRSGSTLVLSWPASATDFVLQSTLSLTSPVTWINSTYPRVLIGNQFTVTTTNSGPVHFYRLRKP